MAMSKALRTAGAALLAGAALFAALPAAAQQPGGDSGPTLRKIREQGVIYLGYSEGAVPFSFVDARGEVQGYTWDLCGQVVQAVRETLALPGLKAVPVPVTPTTRFMAIRSGLVDLECGATATTPSRQKLAAFSLATYVATIKVLVKAEAPVRTLADLDGKRVVTTVASGAERYVKTANALRGAKIVFLTADSHPEALRLVAGGKADAFVLDDAPLAELKARAADPAAYRWLDESLAIEPYAIVLPPGDDQFKQLVDGALARLMKSGEAERLYDKWFMSPALPDGIALGLPMSVMLKERFANPGDR